MATYLVSTRYDEDGHEFDLEVYLDYLGDDELDAAEVEAIFREIASTGEVPDDWEVEVVQWAHHVGEPSPEPEPADAGGPVYEGDDELEGVSYDEDAELPRRPVAPETPPEERRPSRYTGPRKHGGVSDLTRFDNIIKRVSDLGIEVRGEVDDDEDLEGEV